ncbi:MAG: class I SAM-dependent methyltransferase [Polyangiaceae bacterium]
MSRYKVIYESKADAYDLLVSREDYDDNALRAIVDICPLEGKVVAEFGAGTGRLTVLLAPKVARIDAFDLYPAMAEVANAKLRRLGLTHASVGVADNKSLPIAAAVADLSVAGWTFGHCTSWYPDTWREEIGAAVSEMLRVTKKGGHAIVLETLGTGALMPKEPNAALGGYYRMLEDVFGFVRTSIRTDYRFSSLEEGETLTQMFFGRTFSFEATHSAEVVLPECTGVWSRIV